MADSVAGAGKPDSEFFGGALNKEMVVGVLKAGLQRIVVNIGDRAFGFDPGDPDALKFEVGHGAGRVLGQRLINFQTDFAAGSHFPGNQVGGNAGVIEQIAAKRKYLKKNKGKLKKQLQEFHGIHHGDREKDEILINVLETENFSGRIRMLFDSEVYRQKKLDNLIVKVLFLTNHML